MVKGAKKERRETKKIEETKVKTETRERGAKGDSKELLEIKAQLVIRVVEMDVTAKRETKEIGEKNEIREIKEIKEIEAIEEKKEIEEKREIKEIGEKKAKKEIEVIEENLD